MESMEQIVFEIIAATGDARSTLMKIIADTKAGHFDHVEADMQHANEMLKKAQQTHLKIISAESGGEKVDFSLLLVHAEDQMMAAELIRDLTTSFVDTNRRLYALEQQDNHEK